MKWGLSLMLGMLLIGCSSEPTEHYGRVSVAAFMPKDKRPYGTVKVFEKPEDLGGRDYEKIGMLTCNGSPEQEAGILNAMLYRAADMGGDGLLLDDTKVDARPERAGETRVDVRWGLMTLMGDVNRRIYKAYVIELR